MTDKEDATNKPEQAPEPVDEQTLEKLAVEELMREAVQGAARAEIVGPSGWIRNRPPKTNNRFLVNTLRHAENSNKYHKSRSTHRASYRDSKSPKRDRRPEPTIKKDRPKRKS